MSASLEPAAATEPAVLERGADLVDGIQVLRHLHRSTCTDVYDAWSWVRGVGCVVKLVRPDMAADAMVHERTRREGEILLSLTHPHIVRAYELHEDPAAIVLERLWGGSLREMVHVQQRLVPWPEIITWAVELCGALGYLHRSELLHLDVKIANIIVEGGRSKLLDLHLSRPPGACPAGHGTRVYLAPEQARGEDVSSATDVWGLGMALYECAAGRRPFLEREDVVEHPCLEASEAPPVRTWRTLPARLADAIDGCLTLDPAQRPSLEQVSAHLQA